MENKYSIEPPLLFRECRLVQCGKSMRGRLLFSRRIGIGGNGNIVPINGGARLSGKINSTNVGLLTMFTDEVGSRFP